MANKFYYDKLILNYWYYRKIVVAKFAEINVKTLKKKTLKKRKSEDSRKKKKKKTKHTIDIWLHI